MDLHIEVTGIEALMNVLHGFEGHELEKVTQAVVRDIVRKQGVPLVKQAITSGTGGRHGHATRNTPRSAERGGRGERGPMARNVTARTKKRRRMELFAFTIGPRAWYSHFPIAGTGRHTIEARDASGARATTRQVRTINDIEAIDLWRRGQVSSVRGTKEALRVADRFYQRVEHPGSRPNAMLHPVAGQLAPHLGQGVSHAMLADAARRYRAAKFKADMRRAIRRAALRGP